MAPNQIISLMLNTVLQNAETMQPVCTTDNPSIFIRNVQSVSSKTLARLVQGANRHVLYLEVLTHSSSYVVNFMTFDHVPVRTGEVKIKMNHIEFDLRMLPADSYLLEIMDELGDSQLFEVIKMP
jgi:hypothetical protein